MTTGKLILGILGGGLVIGIAAVGIGWLQRDAILESQLEQNLSAVTGVEAQINDIDSQPFQGEFVLDELTLSNPEGFQTPYILEVDRLEIKFDPDTLWEDTVKIQFIAVEGVRLKLEQKLARNNLVAIIDQLQESKGGGGRSDDSGAGPGKKIEIERLTIKGIDASVKVSAIAGLGLTRSLEISDVEVNNLDSYNAQGKLLEAVSAAVTTAILKELGKSANPGSLIEF